MSSPEDKIIKKKRSKKAVELVESSSPVVPEIPEAKKDEIVGKIYNAVSLFSGMGGDTLGMTQAGCKVIAYNELKPTFCKTHHENFPDSELICDTIQEKKKSVTINDISKLSDSCFVKYKGKTDVLFAGFPCFVKDTLVLTHNGYKEVQNVSIDDKLLTHTGKFQNIINLQRKEYNGQLYDIKLKYHPEIISSTEEHPFYVREQKKVWNNTIRKYEYLFGEPEWKNASKLTMNDYFGMVINTESEIPTFDFGEGEITLNSADMWFTIGYYIGNQEHNSPPLDTIFGFDKDDTVSFNRVTNVLRKIKFIRYSEYPEFSVEKDINYFVCKNSNWNKLLNVFSILREQNNKTLPEWIHNAPKHLINEFIEGYIQSNGFTKKRNKSIWFVSSRNLMYEFQRLYLKIGKIIEGIIMLDKLNQCIYLDDHVDISNAFIEDNYVWYAPYKITTRETQNEPVYNFEVETDNSYTVYNTVVHNCQGFSNAGKKAVDDPRNTLFLEFLRAAKLLEPSLIIGENVKGLLSRKTSNDELYIDVIVAEFEKIGYNVIYQVFKTEKFNVPQSRERLIIIGVKKDNPYGWTPKFPTEMSCNPNLKSIVKYSMEGAAKVDPNWFEEIPKECIISDLSDTKVYPDNNGAHPYLMSMINADEEARFYKGKKEKVGKQHEYLFSFGKRNSPIHCEIVDIREPCKTIICTYDHQPRLYVPIQNASGCYLRMFTPDELKQIQGFPSDYKLCGNMKEQIVQIGNAVPPPLIRAVVEKIIK